MMKKIQLVSFALVTLIDLALLSDAGMVKPSLSPFFSFLHLLSDFL